MSCSDSVYLAWRRKAKRFAKRHGFYWLPCVICGNEHGGQEAGGGIPVSGRSDMLTIVCPECTAHRMEAAERRLRELGETAHVCGGVSSWSGDFPGQTIAGADA